MTITLATPTTSEALLHATAQADQPVWHTSRMFVYSLGHNALFKAAIDGPYYQLRGTPRHITVYGDRFLDLDLFHLDGTFYKTVRFGINATVHRVVGGF
jgi:hypothetical protein